MKSGQSLPGIYQTYPKSGHTFGGHTQVAGFFICGMMGRFRYMIGNFTISIIIYFQLLLAQTGWSHIQKKEEG